MKYFLLSLLLGLSALNVLSQTVKVRDYSSGKSIDNVAVFNPEHTRTALSNIYGDADISAFQHTDSLIFQHAAYELQLLTFTDLEKADFIVRLQKKSVNLDEIIISATRFEKDIDEIPNRMISITAEKVEFENPQTTADMLYSTGEVFVQKSQMGGGSPMIRGFAANKVLIVVDGVRMNNAIFRGGNLQNVIAIDPNALRQTEVIFGPGTVIYGSDALGGVMSFMTIEPGFTKDKKFTSAVNFMTRYSSANTERTGHLDVMLSGKKWSTVTSFTSAWYNDLMMGSNGPDEYLRPYYVETQGGEDRMIANSNSRRQNFSGYDQLNIMQKFRLKPVDWVDITYGFHYSESSDIPRYDRLIQYSNPDTLKYASWYYGPQKWMMNALNIDFDVNCRMITKLKLTLAWQHFEESRHSRKFNDPWFKNQYEDVDMFTANVDIVKRLDEKNTFYYGFEGMYNDVQSTAFKRDYISGEEKKTGTRYPDGSNNYNTWAGYLNYEHQFDKQLSIYTGLRYSYVKLYSTIEDTSLYHLPFDEINLGTGALNGSVGMSWHSDVWQFRYNLSSGFRAPNLDDVGKVFDSSPGNVVVPNPDLKPEYAYSADAGIQRKIGEYAEIDFSAFYTYLVDAMVRRDYTFNGQDSIWYDGEYSQVEAIVNAASANLYGLNAMLMLNMGEHFKLKSGITWMRGEDDEGNALRHVSPLFGHTALIFTFGPLLTELYANYNGTITYDRMAPSERDKPYLYAVDDNGNPYAPSWWTINLKASIKVIDELNLDLGVENIFDQRYRPYSSGIAAPGRNFIIALRAKL